MTKIKSIARLTGHNASIFALTQGKEAQHFLSAAGDGWIVEWDVKDPELGKLIAKAEVQLFSLAHLPELDLVVAGDMNGGVHWLDLEDPTNNKHIAHHQKGTYAVQVIDNELITLGGNGVLTKWSIAERRTLESIQLSHAALRACAYSAERSELAIGASDHAIYILDWATWEVKHSIQKAHDNSVFSLAYHPNQQQLLSGGRDALLKAWNLSDWAENQSINAHWFTINHIIFLCDGKLFATASRDKTIKLWDAETFQLVKVLEGVRDSGHVNSVNRLFWLEEEALMVSCGDDRSIILWQVEE